LLGAVGRILGGIEIDGDVTSSAPQPFAVTLDHHLRERLSHPEKLASTDAVLEAREGRLRGQGLAVDRIPSHQHLVHGILGEARSIVAVRIATRDAENSLRQQFFDLVPDLAPVASVPQVLSEALCESESKIGGFEQHGTAIGAAMDLIEAHHDMLPKQIWKQQTLCRGIFGQAKASSLIRSLRGSSFVPRGGFSTSSNLMNYPG
jgi:hypothetical protein